MTTDLPQKSNLNRKNPSVIVGVVLTIGIAVGLFLLREHFKNSRSQITPKQDQTASGPKDPGTKAMTVPVEPALEAVILDINDPVAVKKAAEDNAWLKSALDSPLGKGFGSGWNAFLLSKGEDLQASFKGTVLSYVAEQMLSEPFSLVWFGGGTASGAPALIIEKVSGSVKTAIEAMDKAAARGAFSATHCPGQDPPIVQKDKDGNDIPAPAKHTITRWLVADHPVFVGRNDSRIVLGSKPTAVLQGLCVKLDHSRSKAAIELTLLADRFGREAQALTALLGVDNEVRFSVNVAQGVFSPAGLSAVLAQPERLATEALSDDVLKVIPDDTGVVATLQVALPQKLDEKSIADHLKGEHKGKLATRQVALVWNPHGARGASDVALVWGKLDDEAALKSIFNGRNALVQKKICGQLVFASNGDLAARMEKSCKGNTPSRLNAAAAIVTAVKAPQSVALQVQMGSLFSQLMLDAYRAEQSKAPKGLPKEIEQAKQQLEALPFFGFRGRASGKALVAEGFRS